MPRSGPFREDQIAAAIRPELGPQRTDREIARRSRDQHGVVTLAQLTEMGLSERAARWRVATGRLHRAHRGVFSTAPLTHAGRWMAAVLAMGEGAVLSHRSAGELWGIVRRSSSAEVHVTVPNGRARRRPGIAIHRTVTLEDGDVAVREGIPCTALARTLLDLAATVEARELERAIDRAEELRLFDLGAIRELLGRSRGLRGTRALGGAIDGYGGPAMTRSEAEERLLALVRDGGLPAPEVNTWIALPEGGGYRPDFLWRDARLIVEVDGRAFHARRRAFAHDRRRDRRLALAGYETRRYAADEVLHAPDRVVAELCAFLATPHQ